MTAVGCVENSVTVFKTADILRCVPEDRSRDTKNLRSHKCLCLGKKKKKDSACPDCVFFCGFTKRNRKIYLEHLYYEKHLSSYKVNVGVLVLVLSIVSAHSQQRYLNCHITWNLLITPFISCTEGR